MSFRIRNKYYEQADCLFIGSPESPCFAELFIQRVEEVSVYTMLHAPRIWICKVDDTFTINNHETNDTLTELNQIHPPNKVHCRGGGEWSNSFLGLFSIEN